MPLDDRARRSVYISEGLAHGLLALHHDSTVMYLCSEGYHPAREHTIRATDPAQNIQWPSTESQLVLSERDAHAPTRDDVHTAGLLPAWHDTRTFINDLRRAAESD